MNRTLALLLLFAFSAALSAYDFSAEPVSPADSSTAPSPQVTFQFIYHKGAMGPDSINCNVVASDKIAGSTYAADNAVASVTAILPAGSYVWQVSCRDAINETSSPPRTVSVIADPHVYLDSPQPDAVFQAGQQVILSYFYFASGASPTASCSLLLDGIQIQSDIAQSDATVVVTSAATGAGSRRWQAKCLVGPYPIESETRAFSIAQSNPPQNDTAPPVNGTDKTSGISPPDDQNSTPPGGNNAPPGGENSNPAGQMVFNQAANQNAPPGSRAANQNSPPQIQNANGNPATANSAGAASGNPASASAPIPNSSRNASATTAGGFPPDANKPKITSASQGAVPSPPRGRGDEGNPLSGIAQGADGGVIFLLAIAAIAIIGAACFLLKRTPAAPEGPSSQKKAKRKKSA